VHGGYRLRVPSTPSSDPQPADQPRSPLPWSGKAQRDDRIIISLIALAGVLQFALWPLVPALVESHPALLELIRGSTASIINMGARARIGETSIVQAILLAIPSLMMFDWVFWWAGRRWGDAVFVWLTGGPGPRTEKRLARLHWLESRFGPFAVVLAYFLPVPSVLVYAAVGDGGMGLATFLALDVLGTLLWTGLLATLGYELGQGAVDVTNAIGRYSLWVTLGIVAVVMAAQFVRRRAGAQAPPG
jgi:membrane protein DedA with SNARE-associated domain